MPPSVNGVIFLVVDKPVVTISAITPSPGVGSSPTLLFTSLARAALSVYMRNHPAVDNPT